MLKQFPPVKRTTQSPDENTFDSLWSCPLSLSIRVFIKSVTSITNPQPPSIHLVIKKTILIVEGKFIIHGFHGWKVFCFPCFPHIFCTIPQWLWPMYIRFFPQERLFLPTDLHPHCHEEKHANIGSQTKTTFMNKLTKTIYQNEVWHECNFLYCCHYCCWVTACVRVVMLIVLHLTHLCCKYWYIVRNSACLFNS